MIRILDNGEAALARALARRPISLVCDLDGTLLDFADKPDQVRPPKELLPTMNALYGALNGAVAIISGRSMASLDGLLKDFKGLRLGLHGGEMKHPDPAFQTPVEPLPDIPAEALVLLRIFAEDHPELYVEDKGPCVAIHHRATLVQANQLELRLKMLMLPFGQWQVLRGRQVLEIRPLAANKKRGAAMLLEREEFVGRTPVCLGDDTTDIDLFKACKARGGINIAVDNRVAQYADFVLPDPAAARSWLANLKACLDQDSA